MVKTFVAVLAALIVGYFFIAWVTGPSALEQSISRLQKSTEDYKRAQYQCMLAGCGR
jgi:hypothetical protein